MVLSQSQASHSGVYHLNILRLFVNKKKSLWQKLQLKVIRHKHYFQLKLTKDVALLIQQQKMCMRDANVYFSLHQV